VVLDCKIRLFYFHLQLDGFIARNFRNQTSALGSFIDPLADKLLISVLFVSLTAVNLLPGLLIMLMLHQINDKKGRGHTQMLEPMPPVTLLCYCLSVSADRLCHRNGIRWRAL